MKSSIFKALSIAIFCFSFVLWTDVRSMEISIDEEYQASTGRPICCNSGCCRSGDDCCTHWGLKRWVFGIKEYVIDRCLCCGCCGFDLMDGDRTYIKENRYGRILTTDCCFLNFTENSLDLSCTDSDGGINWVTGSICLPFAALTHLLCLPVACCYSTKDDWWGTEAEHIGEIVKKHTDERDETYRKSVIEAEQYKAMTTEERKSYDSDKALMRAEAYLSIYAPQDFTQTIRNNHIYYNTMYNPYSPIYVGPR